MGDPLSYWLSMDKTQLCLPIKHDSHLKMTLNLTQELIYLKLAREDDQINNIVLQSRANTCNQTDSSLKIHFLC